jgi:hypothetical protein
MDNHSGSPLVDPMTSDPALKDLEERMRQWLRWEGSKNQPRVAKLHRTQVEVRFLKALSAMLYAYLSLNLIYPI